jgi:hypothetical protein
MALSLHPVLATPSLFYLFYGKLCSQQSRILLGDSETQAETSPPRRIYTSISISRYHQSPPTYLSSRELNLSAQPSPSPNYAHLIRQLVCVHGAHRYR